MKYRIRATFTPPTQVLRRGVPPEQVERLGVEAPGELAYQLSELIYGGDTLIQMGARVVIEITPEASVTNLREAGKSKKGYRGDAA